MTPTAFLSLSFSHRHEFTAEIATIRELLIEFGYTLTVFVEKYNFAPNQASEMMQTACAEIETADLLIAEVTYKEIGVGVEVGYAAALRKPIIYIRRTEAEPSTTVGGLATYTIPYQNPVDLRTQLLPILRQLQQS